MALKDRLGLDGFDLVIHAGITFAVITLGFSFGGEEEFFLWSSFVLTGSLVVLAIRRALALRRLHRTQPPELEAERIAMLESRVEDLEAAQARMVELEERLDFTERMLAREAATMGEGENRLSVARGVLREFISGRRTDRIGVVAFAARPYPAVPLTRDHRWLQAAVDRLWKQSRVQAIELIAAATERATAVSSSIRCPTEAVSSTAPLVASWMAATCSAISSVAREVWLASAFTSEATTAKPRPASPARAASIVALSASRLVCEAISEISPTTEPIRSAASCSERMVTLDRAAKTGTVPGMTIPTSPALVSEPPSAAASSLRMMPSLTVVVSSDTDIYISPGLYGDCLPTSATDGATDSFRVARNFVSRLSSCSHMARGVVIALWTTSGWPPPGFMSHRRYGHRQSDVKRL